MWFSLSAPNSGDGFEFGEPYIFFFDRDLKTSPTKRSMVENAVYRYKAIIGPEMRTRTLARQRVEHRIGCEILNKMTALGMPDTYCAG